MCLFLICLFTFNFAANCGHSWNRIIDQTCSKNFSFNDFGQVLRNWFRENDCVVCVLSAILPLWSEILSPSNAFMLTHGNARLFLRLSIIQWKNKYLTLSNLFRKFLSGQYILIQLLFGKITFIISDPLYLAQKRARSWWSENTPKLTRL